VDADGKPDLWTLGPYSASATQWGSGFTKNLTGPPLLAHATPTGGFSLDDARAVQAARESCKDARGGLVHPTEFDRGVGERVVCARLRGESAAAIVGRIDKECPRPKRTLDSPCVNADLWARFAQITPPVWVSP
jgi:hypothetical protein